MSRFIEKLKQVSQGAAQPIGFRTAPSAARLRPLLVARLAGPDIADLAGRLAGADAALVPISQEGPGTESLKKIYKSAGDIIWGGWLKGAVPKAVKQATSAGGDFVVFTAADTPLSLLENDELGKVLAVEASLDEGLLRAIAGLPADAVMVYGESLKGSMLTWRHLMLFKRFASLVAQPLLVPVPAAVSAKDLQTVWEAGVMGVVVEVTDKQPLNRLKELRRLIDGLTPPSSRKRGEMQAVVPGVTAEAGPASFEEDEEE